MIDNLIAYYLIWKPITEEYQEILLWYDGKHLTSDSYDSKVTQINTLLNHDNIRDILSPEKISALLTIKSFVIRMMGLRGLIGLRI